MTTDNETLKLLTALRDGQAESIALMKQALDLQRSAVENQQKSVAEQMRIGKLYRRVVGAGGVVVLIIILIVIALLGYLQGML